MDARVELQSGARLTSHAIRTLATLLALRPLDIDPAKSPPKKRIAVRPPPPAKQGRTPIYPWPRNATDGTPLGVDFTGRSTKFEEVKKLLLAGRFRVDGIDFEDLHMIIVETIVRRNRMPCAFNPKRSSFGHYVHLLSKNVCINLSHAQKRVPELTDTGDLAGLIDEGIDDPTDRLDAFESLTREERQGQPRRTA